MCIAWSRAGAFFFRFRTPGSHNVASLVPDVILTASNFACPFTRFVGPSNVKIRVGGNGTLLGAAIRVVKSFWWRDPRSLFRTCNGKLPRRRLFPLRFNLSIVELFALFSAKLSAFAKICISIKSQNYRSQVCSRDTLYSISPHSRNFWYNLHIIYMLRANLTEIIVSEHYDLWLDFRLLCYICEINFHFIVDASIATRENFLNVFLRGIVIV